MVLNFILLFFRAIGRFFSKLFRLSGNTARTSSKAGSGLAAKQVNDEKTNDDPPAPHDLPDLEKDSFESILFKQLERPRLSEGTAADLTLEQARTHLEQANVFYTNPFPLFARSDFFYEEVEEEYLNTSLGYNANSIDERFLRIMNLFRRTLNDNTRFLLTILTPVIFMLALAVGIVLYYYYGDKVSAILPLDQLSVFNTTANPLTAMITLTSVSLIGVFIIFLLFSWPFKVSQQRNLLNLDNYLTSKFARINNNFQVAKRRALNVERNKRMTQTEELKDEAGVWTLAYQWFGMRLMLCELMIRNRLYQVRRNTILYWLAGVSSCIAISIIATCISFVLVPENTGLRIAIGFASLIYIALSFIMLKNTSHMMAAVLQANEWSRFHLINLHKTVQDHVGEDKVQIVTFRDRNRME